MTDNAIWVDMDGTLADCGHRLHWVERKPKNYDAFEAECHKDPINKAVLSVIRGAEAQDIEVLIVSARMDNRRHLTEQWLEKHNIKYSALYMRKHGDSRKDDIVKKELLDKLREDGYTLLYAIDDRKRVKRMLVENGVFVLDVNQKDKEY